MSVATPAHFPAPRARAPCPLTLRARHVRAPAALAAAPTAAPQPHPSRAPAPPHRDRAPARRRPTAPTALRPPRASQLDDFLTALAKCETRATAAKVKAQAHHLSQGMSPRAAHAVDNLDHLASELPQLASNAAAVAWAAQLAHGTHGPRTSRSARSTRQNILGQNPDSWGRSGVLSPPWGSSRDATLTPCGPGPMGTPRSRRTSREIQSSGPWQGTFRPSWGAEGQS